jgi:NADH dehydrogenase
MEPHMDDMPSQAAVATTPSHEVVILGAGYGGLMAALRLSRRRSGPRRIALINSRDQFVERIRLQERISGPVAPRIPSIAALVAGTGIEFIHGTVTKLDPASRHIRVACGSQQHELTFDRAIYALGSHTDLADVPGATAHAYRLEASDGPRSVTALRERLLREAGRALRVVIVGGRETAIEVAGEIKTNWPDVEVTMISRQRCGDFKGAEVAHAIRRALERLGVGMIDNLAIAEVRPDAVVTASGEVVGCDICVWSGGLRAPALARKAGLSTDPRGRILVDPNLRSISHPHVIAVGDAAHPVAPTGADHRMSAYAALVTGAYAADFILAERAARPSLPFSYSAYGQGVAIGRVGVGFTSYPDDRRARFLVTGRTGQRMRNLFVWFLVVLLKAERRHPGMFFAIGRRRVSWQQANQAMQAARAA